jgi:hypothetical protein
MPYIDCSRCGLRTFSAAYRWAADHCPSCGAELPRPKQTPDSRAGRWQFLDRPSDIFRQPAGIPLRRAHR